MIVTGRKNDRSDIPTSRCIKYPLLESAAPGWFAISHRWIEAKKERRELHGKWFKITSPSGVCYRTLTMSGSIKGTPATEKGDIYLDWGAWLNLDGYKEVTLEELELKLEPAGWFSLPAIALSHPDPGYRIASKIALLSLVIALLSLGIALCA